MFASEQNDPICHSNECQDGILQLRGDDMFGSVVGQSLQYRLNSEPTHQCLRIHVTCDVLLKTMLCGNKKRLFPMKIYFRSIYG